MIGLLKSLDTQLFLLLNSWNCPAMDTFLLCNKQVCLDTALCTFVCVGDKKMQSQLLENVADDYSSHCM